MKKIFLIILFAFIVIVQVNAQSSTHYYAGSKSLAVKDSQGEVEYVYQDRLGTDSQTKTLPYGQVLAIGGRFGFTGKEQDTNGLHYFAARYYDSSVGRFTGIDPVDANHPYTYVHNNPLNRIDPSGMSDFGVEGGFRGNIGIVTGNPEIGEIIYPNSFFLGVTAKGKNWFGGLGWTFIFPIKPGGYLNHESGNFFSSQHQEGTIELDSFPISLPYEVTGNVGGSYAMTTWSDDGPVISSQEGGYGYVGYQKPIGRFVFGGLYELFVQQIRAQINDGVLRGRFQGTADASMNIMGIDVPSYWVGDSYRFRESYTMSASGLLVSNAIRGFLDYEVPTRIGTFQFGPRASVSLTTLNTRDITLEIAGRRFSSGDYGISRTNEGIITTDVGFGGSYETTGGGFRLSVEHMKQTGTSVAIGFSR